MVGGEERGRESDPDSDPKTFIPLFTFLVNRQTIQGVNTQDGRGMEGEIRSRGERDQM